MYLQEIVEVAIGLIFAWLLLSLAVLQIQEVIANILAKRSSDLERVIRETLDGSVNIEDFYNHPLIKSLTKPKKLTENEKAEADRLEQKPNKDLTWHERRRLARLRQRPSYIPSRNFALAVFDILTKAGTSDSPIRTTMYSLESQIEKLKSGDKEAARKLLDGIYELGQTVARLETGSAIQKSVKQNLTKLVNDLGKINKQVASLTNNLVTEINTQGINFSGFFKSDLALDQVRAGANAVADSNLGKSINSLLLGVEEYATNVDNALAIGRKNVEEWFNNTMDRMGGWYKRWTQKIAFVIGLLLAVLLNVDTIYIAQELWRNPAAREASAAYVQSFVEANTQNGDELEDTDLQVIEGELQKINFPVGWKLEEYSEDKTIKLFAAPDEVPGICIRTPLIDAEPYELGFQPQPIFCYEIKNAPTNGAEIAVKILGFIFTAGAAMQGAPFWFDTLKKVVNIRSSGTNPAEKPKENTSV